MPEQQEVESSALDLELISGLADVYQTSGNGGGGHAQKREEAPSSCVNARLTGHDTPSS